MREPKLSRQAPPSPTIIETRIRASEKGAGVRRPVVVAPPRPPTGRGLGRSEAPEGYFSAVAATMARPVLIDEMRVVVAAWRAGS